jgi:hypothetical protein
MTENSKNRRERAGADARSQQEAEAQLVREKTARLRALRLARDAEVVKTAKGAATTGKPAATKRKPRNSGDKASSLSEWLTAQQKDGRHN